MRGNVPKIQFWDILIWHIPWAYFPLCNKEMVVMSQQWGVISYEIEQNSF